MSNTLTISSLTEIMYQARDIVAREAVGFIPSVTVNAGSEAVSLGGTVKSIVTAQPTLNTSHTPAMTIPAGDDATVSAEEFAISQVARTNIPIKGEVAKQLMNVGQYGIVLEQLFAQHIRTLVNGIEAHTGTVVKNGASRALGTAGTTPFASSHALIPQVNQILTDNGCPNDGQRSLVVSTGAATNLKLLSNIYKVNESGSSDVLNRGVLIDIDGVKIRQSAGIASHTKGTASSSTVSNAGHAVGATSLALTAAGTGTIVAGDVINIASENNGINYVVASGDDDVSDGGSIVIGKPGLRFAASAATKAITVGNNYAANMLFHRSAVELVMRPPAMPEGGDLARERMTIFDPVSGLVFEVALYPGYGMNMLEFVVYYQAKVWKSEFVATLLG